MANASTASLQVAITFDDWYASLYEAARPILHDAGAVAAAFLNTGSIGMAERRLSDPTLGNYPQDQFLLWREARGLSDAGREIGSHGVEHLDLTVQLDALVMRELKESRSQIEKEIGTCSPVFAYTRGHHTERLRTLVAQAGYQFAFAGIHAALSETDDQFALPRINIDGRCSLDDFKAIERGDRDYLGWIQRTKAGLRRLRTVSAQADL